MKYEQNKEVVFLAKLSTLGMFAPPPPKITIVNKPYAKKTATERTKTRGALGRLTFPGCVRCGGETLLLLLLL